MHATFSQILSKVAACFQVSFFLLALSSNNCNRYLGPRDGSRVLRKAEQTNQPGSTDDLV